MASAAQSRQTPQTERSVSRVYRVARKIGDDYYTIEEVVVLGVGATDDEIACAIELGTRIYQAQQEAASAQLAQLRAAIPLALPRRPSQRQLNAVAALQAKVGIPTIAVVYRELGIATSEPQTFAEASALIDRFKAIVGGIAPDPAAERNAADVAQPPHEGPQDPPF